MSDYIDFIDSNGNEWTRTTRFREARETIAAQAAVIESLKRAIGAWDRAETPSELQSAEAGLLKSLSIPTDSTQVLAEARKQERERVAQYVQQGTGDWMLGKKIAEAIRAME